MPQDNSSFKADQIVDMAIKYRWYLLPSLTLAIIAGIFFAVTLPKIYQASTLIIYQPQGVSDVYVQPMTNSNVDDHINNISQKILNNTNLERIIHRNKLFEDEEHKDTHLFDKIYDLKERIQIEAIMDRGYPSDSFSISFKGKDPEKVMKVTNALASTFINQNLNDIEKINTDTSSILEDRLDVMRGRLEEVEESIRVYRKTYMGELPDQLESNLRLLDRLQEQLGDRQQNLSEVKIQLASLQRMDNSDPVEEIPEPSELEQLYDQLNALKARYTEQHPDIIKLKERIAESEAQQNNAPDTLINEQPVTINDASLEHQADELELRQEIESLRLEIRDIKEQINLYQKRIENTPKREQELLSLNRDYQNIKTNYDSLSERKLQSEIAVDIHREQKGERFKIIDQAQLPTKPVEPDLPKLFLLFIGLGLGLGSGLIVFKEYLRSSIKNPEEVERELDLPVLGTIPKISKPSAKRWCKVEYGFCICSIFIVICLLGGFAAISFIGLEPTLEVIEKITHI
ncbi:MAG: GNVR domain-containing protein [Desulfobacteraceae bacterium]|jgi:polysaccharide chain length determinant protein (PEP-CTERM system associated)